MTLTAATLFLPRELGVIGSGAYMAGIMEGIGVPCMIAWALFGSSLRRVLGAPRAPHGVQCRHGACTGHHCRHDGAVTEALSSEVRRCSS